VDNIHLDLSEIGEDKEFPRTFAYSFRAGSEFYSVNVEVKERVSFKMGLDLACYVQEHLCEFRVNGLRGWGTTEVEYRIAVSVTSKFLYIQPNVFSRIKPSFYGTTRFTSK
jgi:hypothetical protein